MCIQLRDVHLIMAFIRLLKLKELSVFCELFDTDLHLVLYYGVKHMAYMLYTVIYNKQMHFRRLLDGAELTHEARSQSRTRQVAVCRTTQNLT